jgi:hypothetical protein
MIMKTMKVLATLFVAAAMFALTGCSKDAEKDIIGSWRLLSTTVTETYQGQTHSETETLTEDEPIIYTFNENNTFSMSANYEGNDFDRTGTYSLNNDKLTIKWDDEEQSFTGTVKIDGGDMTMTFIESYDGSSIETVSRMKKV